MHARADLQHRGEPGAIDQAFDLGAQLPEGGQPHLHLVATGHAFADAAAGAKPMADDAFEIPQFHVDDEPRALGYWMRTGL